MAALPSWASYGSRPWNIEGYRLILPLHSPTGRVEDLYARGLTDVAERSAVTMRSSPTVVGGGGLVMANAPGKRLLHTGRWSADATWRTVIIAGGALDYLEWSSAIGTQGVVVLGLIPGSWNEELASRIPDGTRVIVRAHSNPVARRYAHRVEESPRGRCEVVVRRSG